MQGAPHWLQSFCSDYEEFAFFIIALVLSFVIDMERKRVRCIRCGRMEVLYRHHGDTAWLSGGHACKMRVEYQPDFFFFAE